METQAFQVVPETSHSEVNKPTTTASRGVEQVLSKHEFGAQLQREKRRSDRSKAAFSIALLKLDTEVGDAGLNVRLLLQNACDCVRDTDMLGYLGNGCVAVLLTDTSECGTTSFSERIVECTKGVPFSIATATYPDDLFDRLLSQAHETPALDAFLFDDRDGPNRLWLALKRGLDVAGALAAIAVLAPVMAIVAMAVAITSPGPVVFKQVRLGLRGTPFVFYKFRSMYSNADERIHREFVRNLIRQDENAEGTSGSTRAWSKMRGDPRITPLGAFLRSTSLDELPQLFNVLKGDLSLVGPRPPLPYEVEQYEPWHLRRIMATKPGISGLWQVESRGQSMFDDMVRLDLRYIRNCSLKLDLRILLKTVKVVLFRNGAA